MQTVRCLFKDTESKLIECLEYLLAPKNTVPQGACFGSFALPPQKAEVLAG